MAQANPFDQFDTAPAPAKGGPVYGAPPKPDKPDAPKTTWRTLTPEEAKAQGLPADKSYQISSEGKIDAMPTSDTKATVDQQKIATLTTRIAGGFHDIKSVTDKDPSAMEPGVIETMRGGLSPEGLTGMAARTIAGSSRRSVYDAQVDVLDALLTLGTGAAYNKEQLSGQTTSYFPQHGDTADERALKNQRLLRLIEAAKANAGPAWDKVAPVIAPYMQDLSVGEGEKKKDDQAPPLGLGLGLGGEDGSGPPPGEVKLGYRKGPDGSLAPVYGKPGVDVSGMGLEPLTAADQAEIDHQNAVNQAAARDTKQFGDPGLGVIAKNGVTAGLADEAAGVGGFIGGALTGKNPVEQYEIERDAARQRLEQARANTGFLGSVTDLVSGGAGLGTGAATGLRSIGALAKEGAGIGALYGYGNGEGAGGSIAGAVTGAGIGGVLGAGAGKISDVLANRAANRAANPLTQKAGDLAQAGADEGVTVNRAMVDPSLQNRVTGADASIVSGPKVQGAMSDIEGQIAGRVEDLGRGGKAMDRIEAGDTYKGASERFIKQSGVAAARRYDRAEQLAGDARVAPTQSLQRVDDMIRTLSETPTSNAKEIGFLEGLKSDLSQDLSVGALRRMRTSLRKKISTGDLVFGEDEARVLSIMDAAGDDIRAGLAAQGKQDAARAFDTADKAYRARMEYINNTLQKVIGKRNANMPSEAVADRVASMAKGKDAAGLKKFYATLTPEEQADAAATFAEQIGQNNKGDFSVAHFLSQTTDKKFPTESLRVIFGPRGAKSIENLRALGAEVQRVTSAMNSRTSKTAVAGDWRSWLTNLLLSGGGGAGLSALAGSGASGAGAAAAGAAALTMGAKAGRDLLSARALLSPDLTKWIATAPRNATPAMIAAHIRKLSTVAVADAAVAADARGLQQYLMQSLNQSPLRAAAAGQQESDGRRVPVQ